MRGFTRVLAIGVVVGCGGGGNAQGELNGHCYPNGTCNVTLSCEGGVCIPAVVDAAIVDHEASIDAALDAARDAAVDGNGCLDMMLPSTDHVHAAGGTSNAGLGCVTAGCHLVNQLGAGAPAFEFAGTVYATMGSQTPAKGIAIVVTSSIGTTAVAYTTDAGNFNILNGSLANPFPATTLATGCPTVTPMISELVQGGGNCNGCHVAGGTAGSPIYLQ